MPIRVAHIHPLSLSVIHCFNSRKSGNTFAGPQILPFHGYVTKQEIHGSSSDEEPLDDYKEDSSSIYDAHSDQTTGEEAFPFLHLRASSIWEIVIKGIAMRQQIRRRGKAMPFKMLQMQVV